MRPLRGCRREPGISVPLRAGTSIEAGEDAQEFRGVHWPYFRRSTLPAELPQAAIPECLDHRRDCMVSIVNHEKGSAEAMSRTAQFRLRSLAPQSDQRSSAPPIRKAARLTQWGMTPIGPPSSRLGTRPDAMVHTPPDAASQPAFILPGAPPGKGSASMWCPCSERGGVQPHEPQESPHNRVEDTVAAREHPETEAREGIRK